MLDSIPLLNIHMFTHTPKHIASESFIAQTITLSNLPYTCSLYVHVSIALLWQLN